MLASPEIYTVFFNVMRKIFFLYFPATLLCTFLLLVQSPFAAEAQPETAKVQLRIAKHADYYRIVFTSDDATIQKAALAPRDNGNIRIDFGRKVTIELNRKDADGNPILVEPGAKKPTEYMKGVLVTARPQGCSIVIENFSETKTLKLTSPSRLVIDVMYSRNGAPKKEEIVSPVEESAVPSDAIVIDAGHGGDDKGIHGPSVSEKDVMLGIARDVAAAIGKKSRRITLTRKGDLFLSLDDRIRIAKGQRGALYLSIHAGGTKEAVVYTAGSNVYTERSESLAHSLAANLGKELGLAARFDRLPGLYIAAVSGPAVLIELPSPLLVQYDRKMRERVLKAILASLPVAAKAEPDAAKPQRPAPQPQQPFKKKLGDEI